MLQELSVEELAKIGEILHKGTWQHVSLTANMARDFIEELKKEGLTVKRKEKQE